MTGRIGEIRDKKCLDWVKIVNFVRPLALPVRIYEWLAGVREEDSGDRIKGPPPLRIELVAKRKK